MMFNNQKVLVTGGSGMIGRQLVKKLVLRGAKVTIADLTEPEDLPENVEFVKTDLRFFDNCLDICKGMNYVFHLAGVKGSPKMCLEQPVDFMVPMLQFNTNMIQAAYEANVDWFLYTSSVGVYSPAEVFQEDSVWSTFPSPIIIVSVVRSSPYSRRGGCWLGARLTSARLSSPRRQRKHKSASI